MSAPPASAFPAAARARAGVGRLLAVALLAAPPPATAIPPAAPAPLRVDCRSVEARLLVTVDLAPAIDDEVERRLGNGLAGTVRLTVAALDAGGAAAATATRDVAVLFDAWSETFTVAVREGGGAATRVEAADWAAVRRLLAAPDPFDLGPVAALPERFTVEARLELDPLTAAQLERTREQLTHPAGGPAAGGRSLLGTLAAFLLRAPPPVVERYRSSLFSRAVLATP